MRRNLIWLAALVALSALLWAQRPPNAPVADTMTLRLTLRPNLEQTNTYWLNLSGQTDHLVFEYGGPNLKNEDGEFNPEESLAFIQQLREAGAWAIGAGDSGDPEAAVYYTEFSLDGRTSKWRGLPEPQARVAQVFLNHPRFEGWVGLALDGCARAKTTAKTPSSP